MMINQSPDHKDRQYQEDVNELLDEMDSFFNYQGEKKLNNGSKMYFLNQRALKIREAASKGSRESVDGCSEQITEMLVGCLQDWIRVKHAKHKRQTIVKSKGETVFDRMEHDKINRVAKEMFDLDKM